MVHSKSRQPLVTFHNIPLFIPDLQFLGGQREKGLAVKIKCKDKNKREKEKEEKGKRRLGLEILQAVLCYEPRI